MAMEVGLLWYDPDGKKPVRSRIDEAAERFAQKHQIVPNLCLVHTSQVISHEQMKIESNPYIQPNNFMVGIEAGTEKVPYDLDVIAEVERPRRKKSA